MLRIAGLLIDTSRHFLAPTAIKQVIDMMSYLKMNALHVHFTDDQSWCVAHVAAAPDIALTPPAAAELPA
jgi:hexosaminidase